MISYAYTGDYSVSIDDRANPNASVAAAPSPSQDVTTTTPTPSDLLAQKLGSFDITETAVTELPIQLLEHVRMYGIAEYYAFARLKTASADRFVALFEKVWDLSKAKGLCTVVQEVLATSAARHDELRSRFAKALASVDKFIQLGEKTNSYAELGRSEGTQGFVAELLQHAAEVTGPRLRDSEHYNRAHLCTIFDMGIVESNLRSTISMNAADHETELTAVKDKLTHVESVMANLIIDLGNLPSECIGEFLFERAEHAKYADGDWIIRCGRTKSHGDRKACRYRLN
ncbi:hypothetical protein LTR95_009510 [Oleoguttula sp. CCFEE 5521]